MPMVALPYTVSEDWGGDSGVAPLRMVGLGSVLCFKIYSSTASTSQIAKVDLMTGNGIAGPFTYDLSSPSCDAATDAVTAASPEGCAVKRIRTTLETPLSLDGADTKDDALEVWMIAAPGTYSGTIRVYLNDAEGEAEKVYIREFSDLSFSRNKRKDINLDLSGAGTTIETSEGIWNADDLVAAKDAINEGSGYVRYQVDGKFTLMDDIDMSEVSDWTSVTTLSADFDGDGFSITHWATSAPLFETVASGVTVSDLTLDENCRYDVKTGSQSGSGQLPAFVTSTNHGTLSGIDSYGIVSMTNGTNYRWIGAIAATSDGTISHCSNHGDFSLRNSASLRVGGIVGQVQGGSVSNCTNAGDLNITACSYACLGGIVGRIQDGTSASVSQMENSGALSAVSNDTDSSKENEIGGIVGSSMINLTLSDATNKGAITFSRNNLNINTTDNIGGVLGHNVASASATTLTRVYNDTGADISATINRGSVGGVVGWGKGAVVSTSWNKGNIDVSGNSSNVSRSGIGGVIGTGDKDLTDAYNYGRISVEGENKYYPQVGGIRGAVEGGKTSTNIHNYASITVTAPGSTASVGGIDGYHDNSYHVNNSSNSGDITLTSSASTNYVGGIYGGLNGQVNSGTNTGNIILNSSNSASVNHIGGLAGQKGAANANGTATGNLTFNYTGNQAFAGTINAAHAIGYHSGADHYYYGTFGGTLTIYNASSGTLNCGMLIGLIDGSTSGATLGASGKTLTFYNNATVNGILPSADSADDNYYAGEAFLIGSKTTTGTVTVNPAYISLVSPN